MDSHKGKSICPRWWVLLAGLFAVPAPAVSVDVTDGDGRPLPGAVVVLRVADTETPEPAGELAVVRQKDKRFGPDVVVVQAGKRVAFPNDDPFMHHVYSFSTAKHFDLELYNNAVIPEVTFDTPGIVVLGCNIHDEMRGHIFVADSPWFAITAESGRVVFDIDPEALEQVEVWHPRQTRDAVTEVPSAHEKNVRVSIAVKPPRRDRLPAVEAGEY